MNVTITTVDGKCQYIHDLLTDPTSGCNCLSGGKICLDEHCSVPDILSFDLTQEEMNELKKDENVISVISEEYVEPVLWYTKKSQSGKINLSTYDSPQDSLPHHLQYCQDYNAAFINDTTTSTISTIDCSNVDIVVMDSGIDPTHADLFDDQNNPQVVQFDWTILEDDNNVQILSSLPANYNEDVDGHGTACASLIAGKRCGYAKNAKIYSLKSITTGGISVTTGLKLMLAFQKAKKNNLHGLDSTRPTVFSNSWGVSGFIYDVGYIGVTDGITDNRRAFAWQSGLGAPESGYLSRAPVISSSTDSYFRQIIAEGVHVLTSAGNSNHYINTDNNQDIYCYVFEYTANGNYYLTPYDGPTYTQDVVYGNATYLGYYTHVHNYASPNIGHDGNYSNTVYPMTVVGDVTPVGDTSDNVYGSGGNPKTIKNVIDGITSESRFLTGGDVRYENLSGNFFVKSPYSNFGPTVDIYAPGNGAWAAKSNQSSPDPALPNINVDNGDYIFFNGTSSACPIVAGCLATYLSEYPQSTPLESKNWLIANGIKGNILETEPSYISFDYINAVDQQTYTVNNVPFGANYTTIDKTTVPTQYRFTKSTSSSLSAHWGGGDVEDLLYCVRFFESNNVIAQAYPLRKAVLQSSNTTEVIGDATLVKGNQTTEKVTH